MRQAKGIRKLAFLDISNILNIMHFQTPYQNAGVQSFGDKGRREKEIGTKTVLFSTAVVNSFCPKTAQLLAFWAMHRLKQRIVFWGLLAEREGDSSNALFDTLADWNAHLKAENADLGEERPHE